MMLDSESIRMLHDNVLIEQTPHDDENKISLVLPESAKEKPSRGKVRAVGQGLRTTSGGVHSRVPLTVQEGDTVVYRKWSGSEIDFPGYDKEKFVVLKESDIIAIVNKKGS